MDNFTKVKDFLLSLEYNIIEENKEEDLVIVENTDAGIYSLIIDCEDPILIIEYPLFHINGESYNTYLELLKKNREIVHGAFAITDNNMLIFRDTLQLENLDINELEGTLNSLELLLAEFGGRLIELSK